MLAFKKLELTVEKISKLLKVSVGSNAPLRVVSSLEEMINYQLLFGFLYNSF